MPVNEISTTIEVIGADRALAKLEKLQSLMEQAANLAEELNREFGTLKIEFK